MLESCSQVIGPSKTAYNAITMFGSCDKNIFLIYPDIAHEPALNKHKIVRNVPMTRIHPHCIRLFGEVPYCQGFLCKEDDPNFWPYYQLTFEAFSVR